jgi:hypothetical protein
MAYINIDVDLSEFQLEDITNYIVNKAKRNHERDRKTILSMKKELGGIRKDEGEPNTSKVDQWKDDLWPELKQKFTLEQLETFLNSK